MSNFFLKIFNFFQQRKALLWLLLATIIGLLAFSASRISFVEDISSFLPNNADNKRINEAYQKIGAANKIIVRFTISDNPTSDSRNTEIEKSEIEKSEIGLSEYDLLTDAATRFAEILMENDAAGHIKELMYEVDNDKIKEVTDFITQNLPYFLEEDDYQRIDSLIQLQNIDIHLNKDKELLMSPMGGFVRNVILNDPLHFSQNALKNLEIFKQGDTYNTDNGFIFNDKGECLVIITSKYPVSETENNKLLANEIYKAVNQIIAEFDNEIQIVPFGAALISITNADQIKSDSFFAVSIALVLILALLFYFFRNIRSLFLIALAIIFGALFSLGVIVLFKSTVSIIAIGVSSIIFGIAINYPLHFLAHFRHNWKTDERSGTRDLGQENPKSQIPNSKSQIVKNTIKEIVNPLLIGNITTVGAFLSLIFISSDAMKDLGLFSSFLLVGTIVFVLIFLPHFLKDMRQNDMRYATNDMPETGNRKSHIFGRLLEFSPEKNKFVLLIFLVFTVVLFFFSFGTKFETNLHSINYMTNEQRTEMNKLIEQNKDKGKTIYVVAEGKTPDEALRHYEKFILPQIHEFSNKSGISNFFPSKELQKQKIERWNKFWENKKQNFERNFNQLSEKQGFNKNVFDNFIKNMNKNYDIQEFEYFAPILHDLGENYFSISDNKTMIYTILQLPKKSDIPESLQPWDVNCGFFTFDDTSIAQKMVNALSEDFNNVLYICGFIVFTFLFFSFGRIELALLSFIPLMLGWVWILGLMNLFGLKFNIVNIILATFIFGQGDDYTIFVTEGLIYEYTHRKKMLASFKKSIILSATIMFIAIGALIFAKHPALRSLAELTIIGMSSVVLMALFIPPIIFRWLTMNKGKQRLMPITLRNLASSVFVFTVFLFGCFIITMAGFFLFAFGKLTNKKKLRYHQLMCWIARFVVVRIPHVKTTYNNYDKTIFDKPGVIICNHQSHIDLMCIMSLTPKLIILTNDWVWNSPFLGRLVKFAYYYPVSNGIENAMDKLQAIVEKGYSVMVFPEGTRSEDCSIQRFHRGAFYLAEQLKLDILPVLIHGVGHFLPKKEFMLRKGEIHINVMPRMPYNAMGETIGESAKNMRKFYKEEYAKLAAKVETPDYFSDLVQKNYIYKGPSVERTVRQNLRKNHNYKELISKLSDSNRVLILNCGYGELPLLLSLVHKEIEIVATDNEQDYLNLAMNCMSVPPNLQYTQSVEDEEISTFDSVVWMPIPQ